MIKYWIAVASREHVKRGVHGGFMQVCHGKQAPLKRMKAGDWIIYYSPVDIFGTKEPLRKFTAVGKVTADEPYLFEMSKDFIPWRRNVSFVAAHEVAIESFIDKLSFIPNKQRWGFPFRRGFFEITKQDFNLIATNMGVTARD